MSFFSLIVKNLFRNKTRTILAILGISIGIATIVALGLVTDGLKASTESTLKAGGSDFTITQSNKPGFATSEIDEKRVDEIKSINGVNDAVGVLITMYNVDNNPFVVMGIRRDKLSIGKIEIIEGRPFSPDSEDEVILGKRASQNLQKKVGDKIKLLGREFTITGIYETGSMWEDGGAFMALKTLQNLTKKDNIVSMIFVKLNNNAELNDITGEIENKYPDELTTIKSLEEFNKVNKGLDAIDTASWAISLLAIIIGGIGVVNTMIMSVFERTREIGVLKAVGWRDRRILAMIMGESVLITILAGMIGIVIGVLAVELILSSVTEGFVEPVYTVGLFLRAIFIALFVGVVGGFYPAYRASKLPPTEALRYE